MQGKDEAKVKAEGKGTGKGKFEGHGTGQGKRRTLNRYGNPGLEDAIPLGLPSIFVYFDSLLKVLNGYFSTISILMNQAGAFKEVEGC